MVVVCSCSWIVTVFQVHPPLHGEFFHIWQLSIHSHLHFTTLLGFKQLTMKWDVKDHLKMERWKKWKEMIKIDRNPMYSYKSLSQVHTRNMFFYLTFKATQTGHKFLEQGCHKSMFLLPPFYFIVYVSFMNKKS